MLITPPADTDVELPFVGRAAELEAIRRYNARQVYLPIFVFGPEGCGKSRLFKEAVRRFREWYPDGVAVLVDTRKSELAEAVIATAPVDVKKLAKQLAKAMFRSLSQITHFGEFFAIMATSIPKYVKTKDVKRIFIVVDEVTTTFVNVEAYAKSMESTMNVGRPEELKDVIVNFFAPTSEGYARDLLSRHNYVDQRYIWNLPRRDFEELYYRARELYPGQAPPFDEVWRLYGGNPRGLEELAKLGWDVEEHLKLLMDKKEMRRVAKLLRERGLAELAVKVIEDVDYLYLGEERGLGDLRELLIKENLVMDLPRGIPLGGESIVKSPFEPPPIDKDLGVGQYYAWQMPAYKELLRKALAEQGSRSN
ncbi:hypothetical protein Pcal_1298 [Pyrobaculum calidifontis JCM 11548]|uniref:ATPase domain-containing protein n=1 Tax=Pyrobaculum calidifontis (strain DSM 21063 / JCM 11548 / VA1) TaxID=410359 RepID=A3MVQ5_PYRCJ|nr:hypothetical protein Pcal_1298 [Pyrobaculum calidifontis JCM 11548]